MENQELKSFKKIINGLIKSLNPQSSILNSVKGQLLVESMIGIGITVIGLLGILALLSRSISLNRVISDQFIGNYLAAEGVEVVKNLIDANIIQKNAWNLGLDAAGNYEVDYDSIALESDYSQFLKFDDALNVYNYDSGTDTPFKRKIIISYPDSPALYYEKHIKVNSIVSWTNKSGVFEVNSEDHFFNWQP